MEFNGKMMSSTVIPAAVLLSLGVAGVSFTGGVLVSRALANPCAAKRLFKPCAASCAAKKALCGANPCAAKKGGCGPCGGAPKVDLTYSKPRTPMIASSAK